jgi:flagellar L-ring protein precursor FlgH
MTTARATRITLLACAALAAACTSGVKVQEPTSAKPVITARAPQQNGAIFQDTVSFRPLFEDRRARFVGDTITVVINESTTATKEADMNGARDASVNAGITSVQGLPGKSLQGTNLAGAASSKLATKDGASASNAFTGTITTTVVDVLPNGNLMISGEKQIGINGEIEKLRFSGVVNPLYIVNGNQVSSSTIADARIDVGTHSQVNTEQVIGSVARFFFSFLPFR